MADVSPTRPAAWTGAALAILACVACPARALGGQEQRVEASEQIGVLEVDTFGVSQAAGEKFEQGVEEALAAVGFRVVRSQTVAQKLAGSNYIAGCTFGPCMKEVRTRTGLRRVLVARIQGAGQSYSVVVSLVDTETGHLVSQVAQSCPVCTVEEAITTATLAVVELLTGESTAGDEPVKASAAASDGEATRAAARLELRRRQVRRYGWIFVVSGAVALGLGGGLIATDNEGVGLASAGLGGGLAFGGFTALIWAKSF
jgi:hypothetical protein